MELAVDAAGSPVELQAQLLMDVGAYALMTGDHPAALRAQDAVVRLARSHRMYTTGTTALNNACEIGLELGTSPR